MRSVIHLAEWVPHPIETSFGLATLVETDFLESQACQSELDRAHVA